MLTGAPEAGGLASSAVAGIGVWGRALATELGIEAATTAEVLAARGVAPEKIARLTFPQQETLAATLAANAAKELEQPVREFVDEKS